MDVKQSGHYLTTSQESDDTMFADWKFSIVWCLRDEASFLLISLLNLDFFVY